MLSESCRLLNHSVYNEASGSFVMKLLLMILPATFMVCGVAQLVTCYTEMHTYEVL